MKRRSGGTRGVEDDPTPSTLSISLSSSESQEQTSLPISQPSAIPSSTRTAFTSTETAFALTPSVTAPAVATGLTPNFATTNATAWNEMGHGLRGGVIVAAVIGVVAIVIFSVWFCCGGRALWRRRKKASASSNGDSGVLPLRNVLRGGQTHIPSNAEPQMARGDAPPPRYEEAVPLQHQRLAGGISHVRDDEEAGIVADGKMPLSEIPFEDVTLEHTISGSSSNQSFSTRHHMGRGDTSGHTNS